MVMRKRFPTKSSVLSPLWSSHSKTSLPQLRLKKTKAHIWSNKGLAALLDDLGDVENAPIAQQSPANTKGKSRDDLPWKLPLSPLMDPSLVAAHQRHREPKHKPTAEPSALEVKLRENPYGICHNYLLSPMVC